MSTHPTVVRLWVYEILPPIYTILAIKERDSQSETPRVRSGRSQPPAMRLSVTAFLMPDSNFRNPAGDFRLMNGKCAMMLRESFGLTGLRLDLDQYGTVAIGIHMSSEIRGMYHRRHLQQESSQVRGKRRISDSFL